MSQNEQERSANWEEFYTETMQRHFKDAKTCTLLRGGFDNLIFHDREPIPGVLPVVVLGKKLIKIGNMKMEVEDFVGKVGFVYQRPIGPDQKFARVQVLIYSGINGVIEDRTYNPPRDFVQYKDTRPVKEFIAYTPDELQNILEELYPRSILEGTCARGDQMNRKLIRECSLTQTLANSSLSVQFAAAYGRFEKGDEYIFTDLEMQAYTEGITEAFKILVDSTHEERMRSLQDHYRTCVLNADIEKGETEEKTHLTRDEMEQLRLAGERTRLRLL